VLCALLFAFSFPVEAQQPKKVFRIGYLVSSDAVSESIRAEALGRARKGPAFVFQLDLALAVSTPRMVQAAGELPQRPTSHFCILSKSFG
jgi:hypothetical protein